ncbi:hypothetical protein [Alicyclobacillus vulcanalis]|uniref:Uncharacterized protein n=1 Tax=Alicyclobacillus vulcanalis TaxID=252246 RepID=A0A1N7JM68_9BACL|nr:hypothetical protein [Alicyclobacillus vulcanalis]SIS50397.1 hypothetical protein SAMN05421799_10166 [Alicyclobacillus vulcanalis]
MHVATILLIALLAVVAVFLGVIAFVALTIWWTFKPILDVLGKIAFALDLGRFVYRHKLRRPTYRGFWRRES